MTTTATSTIALVTYETSSRINFAHIVGEMQRSLDKSPQSNYALTWDHDDIATFDFESTRIVLSLEDNAAPTEEPVHDRLLISVGPPSEGPLRRQPEISYEQLCSIIVERVCAYYETQPVYWQQVEECVTSETVDQIFDRIALGKLKQLLARQIGIHKKILFICRPPKADSRISARKAMHATRLAHAKSRFPCFAAGQEKWLMTLQVGVFRKAISFARCEPPFMKSKMPPKPLGLNGILLPCV
jgi:hypothetical protein